MRKESKTAATRLLAGKALALLLVVATAFGLVLGSSRLAYADTLLAFTSDIHNKSGNASANRLGTWLDKVEGIYGQKVEVMASGGDMGGAGASGYWDLAQADMDKISDRGITGVYTTGNHEISMGGDFSYSSYTSGAYSPTETKGQFQLNKQGAEGKNYRIYCLGSVSDSSSYSTQNQISTLTSYLNSVGNEKPIFIITHFPLHYYSSGYYGRTTTGASDVIDALNTAATNNGQKIVFLWGHNHTLSDTYYDYIYKPGDEIPTTSSDSSQQEIQFYYGAAGCMSDSENGTGSAYVKGKGLIVSIDDDSMLTFAYYNANGTNVTEDGTNGAGTSYFEKGYGTEPVGSGDEPGDEPQTGDSVTITPSTDNPEESIKIAVGDTLTINVKNGSERSGYNYTATLSNSGIAGITNDSTVYIDAGGEGQFTVEGLTAGTVDINIQNDQSYSQYARTGVIHLTVGEGGSTPVDPTTDGDVSITPSTSNPEEYAKIAVGETLTIDVTNGSERSGYNYTATLSNSGIAGITSDSTVYIDAGGEGQFTVEGLTAGTVDINIQNDQSYSQYARTGVIHLTVEEAGASVAVTGVTVNPTSASVVVGKTTQLTATVAPSDATNKKVTWTSGDPSIATVDSNGKVTGVKAGTATITVTTVDGDKTATATITVTAPEPGATVTYELVDEMEVGKEYLIATGNSGNVYLLSGEAGSVSDSLKGYAATVDADGKITIDTDTEAKTLYTAKKGDKEDKGSFRLSIGGKYLYANNSGALRLESESIWSQSSGGGSSNSGKYWHYKGEGKNLLWFFLDSEDTSGSNGLNYAGSTYRYYVDYSGSNFVKGTLTSSSTSLANSNTTKIYVYSKVDTPTLDHIDVISAPTEFTVGDEFTSEGIEVAATYSDGAVVRAYDPDIDSSAVDMTKPGTYTVTVSFTADGVTKTTTYDITVVAAATEWVRLAGDDRYYTMAAIVQEGFGSASEAIVCNGKNFPDALMASSLAGALDGDVPVVLTKPTELVKQAADELTRLGVKKVYILGGEAVVSADVVSAIEDMGIQTERISGNNRQATGIAVMQKIDQLGKYDGTIVVATGKKTYAASDTQKKNERGFADALSIGPWCYKSGTPILLTKNDLTLSDDQVAAAKALGVKRLIIVGGESAVSNEVITQLGINPDAVERLGGADRYETSQIIADWEMAHDMVMTNVSVATGANFPDALAGAPLCGKNNSVLLLAKDKDSVTLEAISKDAGIVTGYVLGGEAAVSADLFSYLESLTA